MVALFFAAALHLQPCTIAGAKMRCGTFDVPESPKSHRTLALKVIVLPATEHNESPIFVFAGGPGEPVTPGAEIEVKLFAAERRLHDVVLVDERGAGGSAPLVCANALKKHRQELIGSDLFPPDFIADCRRELEPHADLAAYTFPYFVDDVDALRRALGYDKINVVGLSYGTRAALTFLERHSAAVRTLLLHGPLPPENTMPLYAARDAQAALDRLAAFAPALKSDLAQTLAALDAKPAEVDSGGHHLRITRGGFAEFLRSSMYTSERQARVPLIVHRAAQGDWTSIAPLWIHYRDHWYDDMGVFLSVTCPSDVRRIDPNAIAAATANTFLGDYRVRRQIAACAQWTPGVEPAVRIPPAHPPILAITGDTDPVTPPRWGAGMRTIVLANSGHVELNDCVLKLEVAFENAGSYEHLDDSCAKAITRPPFATELPSR